MDDKVPRYGRTIKSFFLGTGITFFGIWGLIKKDLMDCFVIPDGWLFFLRFLLNFELPNEMACSQSKLKSSEIVKCQLMISYIFDPHNFLSA